MTSVVAVSPDGQHLASAGGWYLLKNGNRRSDNDFVIRLWQFHPPKSVTADSDRPEDSDAIPPAETGAGSKPADE